MHSSVFQLTLVGNTSVFNTAVVWKHSFAVPPTLRSHMSIFSSLSHQLKKNSSGIITNACQALSSNMHIVWVKSWILHYWIQEGWGQGMYAHIYPFLWSWLPYWSGTVTWSSLQPILLHNLGRQYVMVQHSYPQKNRFRLAGSLPYVSKHAHMSGRHIQSPSVSLI